MYQQKVLQNNCFLCCFQVATDPEPDIADNSLTIVLIPHQLHHECRWNLREHQDGEGVRSPGKLRDIAGLLPRGAPTDSEAPDLCPWPPTQAPMANCKKVNERFSLCNAVLQNFASKISKNGSYKFT